MCDELCRGVERQISICREGIFRVRLCLAEVNKEFELKRENLVRIGRTN